MQDVLLHGDCLALLQGLEANSIDCCVTDPPYGLGEVKDIAGLIRAWLQDEDDSQYTGKSGFMGQAWDAGVPSPRYWREVYRVLKPGAHVLCFAGTRTQDLMGLSLRLAGFQYRDEIQWVYGSGFPKSTAIDKQIDKLYGAEREKVRIPASQARNPKAINGGHGIEGGDRPWMKAALINGYHDMDGPTPATDAPRQWQGWGSALKPSHEPILLFRKPLAAGSIAANVLEWGTGGINVDGCRVDGISEELGRARGGWQKGGYVGGKAQKNYNGVGVSPSKRWPPNLLLSHTACMPGACADDCPVAALDEQAGGRPGRHDQQPTVSSNSWFGGHNHGQGFHEDSLAVSRFFPVFYAAKASRRERNAGCEALPYHSAGEVTGGRKEGSAGLNSPRAGAGRTSGNFNTHPTVKSTSLMSWLVRLITPPDGTVLDCFAGSGSTLVACVQEGFHFIGMEQSEEYCTIARARIAAAKRQPAKPRAKITRLPKRPQRAEQLALFA